MSKVADVWQPSRLKGFQVDPGKGLPFLSAGQVFESQPRVRKWLATAMVPRSETRYLESDWIMMSCSGEVGRVTAVYDEHLDKVVTHDLLRVVPRDAADYGWLYAYMKTPTFFAIARSSQYGHMIKHLEPEHVLGMPVAMPDIETRRRVGRDADAALEMRRSARRLQARADEMYAAAVNPSNEPVHDAVSSTVRASSLLAGRRRMEGQFHRAGVLQVEDLVRRSSNKVQPLIEVVKSVTVGARFKRYFGDNGTPYRSASELFDVNAPVTKRVYSALLPDSKKYMLRSGWIIMACSGQTYGLLGRTTVLTENHDGVFGSHDLIRIVPDRTRARTGYLQTALNHVDYGRPRVVRYASGTSVPHLDPQDIRNVLLPRFDAALEEAIADLSEEAIRLAAEADRLETAAVQGAEDAISALTGRHGSLQLVGVDE
ncbi:hypothetical protein [Microbacterium sp. B35-04]|uniref:hypothetical protein n=1 Tax=Microbacterium sp. B35-04 TaxID=1961716 RepID=UPI0013D6CF7C|nr:hypothetical protein [Microbacterium sp. B35-04]